MKFPWYIWIPRILIIAVALFMSLFSLDVFDMQASLGQKLLGLLMHNIPSLLLLFVLILTWKHPFWGGYVFLMLGILMGIWMYIFFRKFFAYDYLAFVFPTLICSVLFFTANLNKKVIISHKPPSGEDNPV